MDSSTNTPPASTRLMDTVKQRATSQLDSQKGRATEGLDVIAQAVRQTTEQLRNEQHDTVAQYIDRAADQIERFATHLRDRNLDELLQDAQQLARRQPALVIGGGFAVGLLAARFLKSSSTTTSHDYDSSGSNPPAYQTSGYGAATSSASGYGGTGFGATGAGPSNYGDSNYGDTGSATGVGGTGVGTTSGSGGSGIGGHGTAGSPPPQFTAQTVRENL